MASSAFSKENSPTMTSKIPPAEWDAIVTRRDNGESVAYIARTYETSPATIYGILKKVAEAKELQVAQPQHKQSDSGTQRNQALAADHQSTNLESTSSDGKAPVSTTQQL